MTISPIQQSGNYSQAQGVTTGSATAPDLFSAMLAMLKGEGAGKEGEGLVPFKLGATETVAPAEPVNEGKVPTSASTPTPEPAPVAPVSKAVGLMDVISAEFSEKIEDFLNELDALGINRGEIHSFEDLTVALKEAGLNEFEIKEFVDKAFELVEGLEEELRLLYAHNPSPELQEYIQGKSNIDLYLEILATAVAPQGIDLAKAPVANAEASLAEELPVAVASAVQKTSSHETYTKQQPVMDLEVRVSRGESLLPETAVQADSAAEAEDITLASSRDESLALERAANKEITFGNENTQVLYRLQSSGNGQGTTETLNLVVEKGNEEALLEEAVDATQQTQRAENRHAAAKEVSSLARTAFRADVGTQVGNQVRILTNQGGGQIKMTLNPVELGEIDISLEVHNGRVSGTITAQNVEVVEQLARDLRTLEQSLAQAGLNVGEEGISFQLQGEGAGQGEQNETGNRQMAGAEDAETAEQAQSVWVSPERVLDIRV